MSEKMYADVHLGLGRLRRKLSIIIDKMAGMETSSGVKNSSPH